MKVAFDKAGYQAEEAFDGEMECDHYFQKSFDLIVMDLFLPKKDGIQAIHEIKELLMNVEKLLAL
jgi:DNA-binding response OmpR family regulator